MKTMLRSLLVLSFLSLCSAEIQRTAPAPTLTRQGTQGLVNTFSAEPMGHGRLTVSTLGSWYRQQNEFANAPEKEVDVVTGMGAVSLGANSQIDLFATIAAYALKGYQGENFTAGPGSVNGGVQMALPFAPSFPVRLAAQAAISAGISNDQINRNNADGYNYPETRTEHDFIGRFIETFSFKAGQASLKLHANQAVSTAITGDRGNLLLLAGGLETSIHPAYVLGIELNSRTFLDNLAFRSDPFWITPSVQFRTPYYMNATFGADVSLSTDRTFTSAKALEPLRLFAGLAFSFDTQAEKRRAQAEKEKQEAMEKAAIKKKAEELESEKQKLSTSMDNLARKAIQDSAALAAQNEAERARADAIAKKAREDSLALARKAVQDSIAAAQRLAEERSKRTEAEKQLLSSGLLLLDAVYFETGKAVININSKSGLNLIGQWLGKYPKLQLEVGGHTDNVGGPRANTLLSQARAEAVAKYLTTVNPGLEGRMLAKGYGPSVPKADNRLASGREQNRRVELKVLNTEVLKEYQ